MMQDYEKSKMPNAKPWNMSVQTYSRAGTIERQRGCFAFMFTNIGDVIAYGNEMVLNPVLDPITLLPVRGETVTVAGHREDIYKGNITLKFDPNTAGTSPLIEIVQLFYTDLV